LRTCPTGRAIVMKATAANTAHQEMECSNMGKCDREAVCITCCC
jgi:hypothetical protein